MFSFVPCLPADAGRAFARPRIELDGLIRPNLAMQARTCAVRDLGELRAIWDRVVDQVLEQGLVLGVLRVPETQFVLYHAAALYS